MDFNYVRLVDIYHSSVTHLRHIIIKGDYQWKHCPTKWLCWLLKSHSSYGRRSNESYFDPLKNLCASTSIQPTTTLGSVDECVCMFHSSDAHVLIVHGRHRWVCHWLWHHTVPRQRYMGDTWLRFHSIHTDQGYLVMNNMDWIKRTAIECVFIIFLAWALCPCNWNEHSDTSSTHK